MADQEAGFQAPAAPNRLHSTPFLARDRSIPERVNALEETLWDIAQYASVIAEVANGARAGKLSSHGSLTLTANSATSTLSNRSIHPTCRILFWPTTENGAAEIAAGGMYTSAKTNESATITHANNAQTDRTFDYFVVG